MKTGIPIIISAPSGAGKTSLVQALVAKMPNMLVSVSHTTRSCRPGEIDGKNYYFVTEQDFKQLIAEDAFLEYAKVFDNYYGTSNQWVEEKLTNNFDIIFEIDWQGAAQIRKKIPEAISIFILPPSMEVLENRLKQRAQDNQLIIEKRMLAAKNEIAHYHEFDYLVINDDFATALQDLQAIIRSLHLQLPQQKQQQLSLIERLLA